MTSTLICTLLNSTLQDCVSGPPSPPIIAECPWPPLPATTTTTTTTTTTKPASDCGEFHREESCDLDEYNIIDFQHDLLVGECQDNCVNSQQCNYFTWWAGTIVTVYGRLLTLVARLGQSLNLLSKSRLTGN